MVCILGCLSMIVCLIYFMTVLNQNLNSKSDRGCFHDLSGDSTALAMY